MNGSGGFARIDMRNGSSRGTKGGGSSPYVELTNSTRCSDTRLLVFDHLCIAKSSVLGRVFVVNEALPFALSRDNNVDGIGVGDFGHAMAIACSASGRETTVGSWEDSGVASKAQLGRLCAAAVLDEGFMMAEIGVSSSRHNSAVLEDRWMFGRGPP